MAKIVFIGDSITKGTDYGGVTLAQTFAKLIGAANGYAATDVINAGVGGDTSAGVLNRLQTDAISQAPLVCVVMVGINDWASSVPVSLYQSNISTIVDALRGANIKPVFISSMLRRGANAEFASFQPYLKALDTVAASKKVQVIDLYREVATAYLYMDSASWNGLYADGALHLSVAGHQFLADLAARPQFAGYFVATPAASTSDLQSLAIAAADYLLQGANNTTLQQLIAKRSKF